MDRTKLRWRICLVLLLALAALAAVAVFYALAQQGIGIPCPLRLITGWECPGCGNSRAALSLMRGDIRAALGFNLLFPLEFGYLGWVLISCCVSYLKGGRFSYAPKRAWVDAVILAVILLWWPLRNLL